MNMQIMIKGLRYKVRLKKILLILSGSAILAFGLYNVHALSGVTEGGILGLTLFLRHWFEISPAWSGLVLNALCYFVGWRIIGGKFILWSAVAGGGFSAFYAVFEQFEPLWPNLSQMPLPAALMGAVFVGVGVGLSVRAGGAPTGDDALAMSMEHKMGWKIQWCYLITDMIVLALSVSYIPLPKLMYSLLTVILSGQIIGFLNK